MPVMFIWPDFYVQGHNLINCFFNWLMDVDKVHPFSSNLEWHSLIGEFLMSVDTG